MELCCSVLLVEGNDEHLFEGEEGELIAGSIQEWGLNFYEGYRRTDLLNKIISGMI